MSTIEISYGVRSIDNAAFSYNLLTDIKIPSSVTVIGYASFAHNQLVNATIPQGVITIGPHAFYENNLTAIELPEGITTIDSMAFANNNITSARIPKSVTTLGERVFEGNPLTYVSISDDSKIDVDLFPGGVLIDRRNVNEYPQDISLSNSSFDEGIDTDSVIALLSSKDPDLNDTFEYSLIAGDGDADNNAFSINADKIIINELPDFETQSSYSIRVQTTDSGGLTFEKAFTFSVNDLDELPTPEPTPVNVTNIVNEITNTTTVNVENSGSGNVTIGDIGSINNITNIDNSFAIQTININLSVAITGDSKKSEKVEGTDGDDLIADGRGKDKLIGGNGADQFYFAGEEPFKKKKVDKVIDFDASEGDAIVIADQVVGDLTENPTLAIADTKKDLKQLSKDGYDLLYFEPKGDLYVDGNGDSKGFGKKSEGGMIADLPNETDLTENNVLIGVES